MDDAIRDRGVSAIMSKLLASDEADDEADKEVSERGKKRKRVQRVQPKDTNGEKAPPIPPKERMKHYRKRRKVTEQTIVECVREILELLRDQNTSIIQLRVDVGKAIAAGQM